MLAARYLGVAPWELPEHSPWKHAALAVIHARSFVDSGAHKRHVGPGSR